MKKIMFIFGTRPEAIKMAPVILAFKKFKKFETVVCFTGQHREIALDVLKLFGIKPDYDLRVMSGGQSLSMLSAFLTDMLDEVLEKENPDFVFVQGDTTSAFIGALCAFYRKIPIGHIEAGLRTFNKNEPFPEEFNRCAISNMADINFCPTLNEIGNVFGEIIAVTGNTIVDAIDFFKSKIPAVKSKKKFILVTTHRRENLGQPLESICKGISELARKNPEIEIFWLLHPNPEVKTTVLKMVKNKRIKILIPKKYFDTLTLIKNCHFIISDSGGIQEEAPSFGKPVLILRNVTERPQGIAAGIAKLIGTKSADIVREGSLLISDEKLYSRMVAKQNPYGDGKASEKILETTKAYFGVD